MSLKHLHEYVRQLPDQEWDFSSGDTKISIWLLDDNLQLRKLESLDGEEGIWLDANEKEIRQIAEEMAEQWTRLRDLLQQEEGD